MDPQPGTLTHAIRDGLADIDRLAATRRTRTDLPVLAAKIAAAVGLAIITYLYGTIALAEIHDSIRPAHTTTAADDPTGAACGDATPGVLTAVAISDPARYGTTQTRCRLVTGDVAIYAQTNADALAEMCMSGVGTVDLTTDAPTVTCQTAAAVPVRTLPDGRTLTGWDLACEQTGDTPAGTVTRTLPDGRVLTGDLACERDDS